MPKSKRKSKANARAARSRGVQVPHGAHDALAFFSGGTNPFRLPDQYKGPTAATTLVSDDNVPATATTAAAIGFMANLNYATVQNTVTTGNLGAAWTPTVHPQFATLSGASYKGRCLAVRVTVRYVGTAQNCSGAMFVGSGTGWNLGMISSGLSQYTPMMREYTMKPGGTWTFYLPTLGAPDFEAISGNTFFSNYLAGLVLLFTGLPSAAGTISIRTERVVEYIPEPIGSVLVAARSEPYDPAATETIAALNGTAAEGGLTMERARSIMGAVYSHVLSPLGSAARDAAYSYLTEAYNDRVPEMLM